MCIVFVLLFFCSFNYSILNCMLESAVHCKDYVFRQNLKNHGNYITSLRYLGRDKIASISLYDGSAKIWDIPNEECMLELTNVHSITPLEDFIIACTYYGGKIQVINFLTEEILCEFYEHKSYAKTILYLEHDVIVSYSQDKIFRIWNYKTKTFKSYEFINCINQIINLKNGNIALSIDNSLVIFDTNANKILRKIEVYKNPITYISYLSNNEIAVFSEIDKMISIVNIDDGSIINENIDYINFLDWIDGRLIFYSNKGILYIWDYKKNEHIFNDVFPVMKETFCKLDHDQIAYSSWDNNIYVYEKYLKSFYLIKLNKFGSLIRSITSLDNKRIAIAIDKDIVILKKKSISCLWCSQKQLDIDVVECEEVVC